MKVEIQVRYPRHGEGMTSSIDEIHRTFRVSKLLDTIPIMLEKKTPWCNLHRITGSLHGIWICQLVPWRKNT